MIETVADQNSVAIHFRILCSCLFRHHIHQPSTFPHTYNVLVEQDFHCHRNPFTEARSAGSSSWPSPEFPVPVYPETQVPQLGQLGWISNPNLSRLRWRWEPPRGCRAPQGITTSLPALEFLISMFRPVDGRGTCP